MASCSSIFAQYESEGLEVIHYPRRKFRKFSVLLVSYCSAHLKCIKNYNDKR